MTDTKAQLLNSLKRTSCG